MKTASRAAIHAGSTDTVYFIFRGHSNWPPGNAFAAKPAVTANKDARRMTAKVTVEDVERVAELAHLKLKPEELQPMLHDLNAILDYVAELNQIDTAGVAPLAQVTELMAAAGGALRSDRIAPSLDRAAVFAQAPETNGSFFKVPKVIER